MYIEGNCEVGQPPTEMIGGGPASVKKQESGPWDLQKLNPCRTQVVGGPKGQYVGFFQPQKQHN